MFFLLKNDFNVYDNAQALEQDEINCYQIEEKLQNIFDKTLESFLIKNDSKKSPICFLEYCFGKSDDCDKQNLEEESVVPEKYIYSSLVNNLVRTICFYINKNKYSIVTYQSRAELKVIFNHYINEYRIECREISHCYEQEDEELNQVMELLDDLQFGPDDSQSDIFIEKFGYIEQEDFWALLRKTSKWLPYLLL